MFEDGSEHSHLRMLSMNLETFLRSAIAAQCSEGQGPIADRIVEKSAKSSDIVPESLLFVLHVPNT